MSFIVAFLGHTGNRRERVEVDIACRRHREMGGAGATFAPVSSRKHLVQFTHGCGTAKCTGGSDGYTDSYTATSLAGYTDIFYSQPSMDAGMYCQDSSTTPAPTASTSSTSTSGVGTTAPAQLMLGLAAGLALDAVLR